MTPPAPKSMGASCGREQEQHGHEQQAAWACTWSGKPGTGRGRPAAREAAAAAHSIVAQSSRNMLHCKGGGLN